MTDRARLERAPPTHAAPTDAPPTHAPPTHAPPTHAPPTHAQPTHAQPTHAQPTHAQPTHAQPTHAQPTHAQPTDAQFARAHRSRARRSHGRLARASLTLALLTHAHLGCGSSPPPLGADERAVGVEGSSAEVRLGAWRCEVPADLLANVDARFEREGRTTRVAIEPAPLGATLEGLVDAEAETLALLYPDHPSERAVDTLGRLRAVRFEVGDRQVWIAMQNPWRVVRVRVRGARSGAARAETLEIGSLSIAIDGALHEATFQGPGGTGLVRVRDDGTLEAERVRCSPAGRAR